MKILAFAASSSKHSINAQLVSYASRLATDGLVQDATVETIDLNDYEMPIYSVDREGEGGIPQAARDFVAKIADADALIVSYAEHNGHFTAAYKNIFDWASRIDRNIFAGRPMVALSASPGPGGAGRVLDFVVQAADTFGYRVVGELAVPNFGTAFDTDAGALVDPELDAQFRTAVASLDNQIVSAS